VSGKGVGGDQEAGRTGETNKVMGLERVCEWTSAVLYRHESDANLSQRSHLDALMLDDENFGRFVVVLAGGLDARAYASKFATLYGQHRKTPSRPLV
jgi:hypothetical protein